MDDVISQVSYPVFLYFVCLFFLIASVFAFIVGAGLATRNRAMLRLFVFMNRWVSVRKMMKPLSVPHYLEPMLLKRPVILGTAIICGAALSIYLLMDIEPEDFFPLFEGSLSYPSAIGAAYYMKWFLIIGNALCILLGSLIIFSSRLLSHVRNYTDYWYSIRKRTYPLNEMNMEVDMWVLRHPTSSGLALIVLSLGVGMLMYDRL